MEVWSNTWTNFRGFRRPTTIRFPRLTLFIGRNNVGKTSTYAPLLLLRQTLEAQDPATALLTRGALLDVGTYADLIYDHDISRQLTFSIGLQTQVELRPESRNPEPTRLGRMEVTLDANEGDQSIRLYRSRIVDTAGRPIITRVREPGGSYRVDSRILPTAQSVGRPLREVTMLRAAMRQEKPRGFFFSGAEALRIPVAWRRDEDRWKKSRTWFNAAFAMQDVYQAANWEVSRRLRSIAYLGPLRSLPSRTYRYSAERPSDVGREGQFAPELLLRTASTTARELVDHWLQRLGYGRLEFEELGEDFFQVFFRMPNADNLRINFAHCGIGLSQLLPLLVQGSTAEDEATFIAQQPEIHLNPAQQCLITDFLIDTAQADRRVVVETHSEHILLRIRRRIAEGRIGAGDVAVYYCDFRDGESVVQEIELGERGEMSRDQWPVGFFEEQLEDAFALAKAQSVGPRADVGRA